MSETVFVQFGWLAALAYAALYSIDHLLGLWSSHLYQQHLELHPRPENDEERYLAAIDGPPAVSLPFLAVIAGWTLIILLAWVGSRFAPFGSLLYPVLVGWLALPELSSYLRHGMNLFVFRSARASGSGGPVAIHVRPVSLRKSALVSLGFAVLFLVAWLVLGSPLFAGGFLGCIAKSVRDWSRAIVVSRQVCA